MKYVELAIAVIGLLLSIILFYRFPLLTKKDKKEHLPMSVSIIIPARNEAANLDNLLNDLKKQTFVPLEIIVIDDVSEDDTAKVAERLGATVIKITDKPKNWLGKSWACQKGSEIAQGDYLLFLDADIRLQENALLRLVQTQQKHKSPISVQPYHKPQKAYEQLSLIFNLVQTAANGVSLPKAKNLGLFGPVILISKTDYLAINGHEKVKKSIIEDVALGQELHKAGIKYNLFVGDKELSYRMYRDGFKSLFHGWTKNIASGATNMSFGTFLLIFLWITSLISVPSHIVIYSVAFNLLFLIIYCGLYLGWFVVLSLLSRKIGRFNLLGVTLFPFHVIFFVIVFFVSLFIKIFNLSYRWKGRSIRGKD